jgi:hypothetical protein
VLVPRARPKTIDPVRKFKSKQPATSKRGRNDRSRRPINRAKRS